MTYQTLILNRFPELYEQGIVRFDEPLRLHTSFQIGGPAAVFCVPPTTYIMAELIRFATQNSIPTLIVGKGSNLLISDKGYRGIVISTLNMCNVVQYQNFIYAECGATLKDVCGYACQKGLTGLEFASGIPGSVGGAVFMNAGAYSGEIKDILSFSVCLAQPTNDHPFPLEIMRLSNVEHDFSYRSSALNPHKLIHLYSVFELKPEAPAIIKAKMDELEEMRSSKQPLDLPSAGSIFKRPPGHFTGQLIDQCNLRGYRIGGAAISDKHCGFIVNIDNATAQNVMDLIAFVSDRVWESYGVRLEPEIRLIGEK